MKNQLLKSVLTLSAFMAAMSVSAQRPIIQTKFTADPAPMVHNDTVFLYTTHDEDYAPEGYAGFRMKEWLLYTSTDMVNWIDHGKVANLHNFSWAAKEISGWGGFDNGAWAPQCIERNGKFYLYCPLQGRGIGVLVGDSPYGPFKDPIGKPLISGKYDSIDPTVFIDDDGQAYLYWGNPNMWYAKLNEDMISLKGEITKDTNLTKENRGNVHFQEGPWIYKRGKQYYMAYASTCCPEGIGYAMGDTPTGPWVFKGYLMKPDGRSSGNHPGIIDYHGKTYLFGFNYQLNYAITDKHHERRSVCVAEIAFNADGTINEEPWWMENQNPSPIRTFNPLRRVEAETMAWSEGIKTYSHDNGISIVATKNGAFIQVANVDFGSKGASAFRALVGGEKSKDISLEIRLDDLNGELVKKLQIPQKTKSGKYRTIKANIPPVTGVHDLYFVFNNIKGEDNYAYIDYWEFK